MVDLRSSRRLRPPGMTKVSAAYLLALIFVIFGMWVPTSFLSSTTFRLVAEDQVVIGIVALALLIPLVCGVFDLSVGAMVAFSLSIVTWFTQHTGWNIIYSCLVALAVCAVVGAISGVVVVYLKVDSFIVTLGMSQVLSAAALFLSQNQTISGIYPTRFLSLGQDDWFGVPAPVYYLAVLALIVWYVLELTPLGRRMFATGANANSARLSGIPTNRMMLGSLVAAAVIAGLAGIVYGMQVGTFSDTFGEPLLFPGFAAVFFGATQIRQRPNVWGTILALYTLAFGVKGIQLAFASGTYWITPLFNGVALIVAVSLARRRVAAAARLRVLPIRRRRERPSPGPVAGMPAAMAGAAIHDGDDAGRAI